jgi:hypothetical protein
MHEPLKWFHESSLGMMKGQGKKQMVWHLTNLSSCLKAAQPGLRADSWQHSVEENCREEALAS